jgi:hypothetical protein
MDSNPDAIPQLASATAASSRRRAVERYIAAKDLNRPYLMAEAFAADATLTMIVQTAAIQFPPNAIGRDAITELLVRRFARTYENVHTFCIAAAPQEGAADFSCDWLVGMSEKEDGTVRVGCGRYDWTFEAASPHLVQRLTITIRNMQLFAPACLEPVMRWLSCLPYPWCTPAAVFIGAPSLEDLRPVRDYLGRTST